MNTFLKVKYARKIRQAEMKSVAPIEIKSDEEIPTLVSTFTSPNKAPNRPLFSVAVSVMTIRLRFRNNLPDKPAQGNREHSRPFRF